MGLPPSKTLKFAVPPTLALTLAGLPTVGGVAPEELTVSVAVPLHTGVGE
jgi:hypothetical protein